MKISKESSGINLVDSENPIIYLNFQGCFTVQLSRFVAVALPRQQNLLYQILFALSTLFFIFFLFLYRVNEYYLIKSIWVCQEFFYFFRVFSTFVLSRGNPAFFHKIFFAVSTGYSAVPSISNYFYREGISGQSFSARYPLSKFSICTLVD